jgi:hypothetical protein
MEPKFKVGDLVFYQASEALIGMRMERRQMGIILKVIPDMLPAV